ncbi:hypothetical protein PF010_g23787 [Phytophthora fragariae]|uniref:Uncharacterized protein n=1 Tax=Phytophthora fragariae TaxID=53985 RepID=A0A6A3WQM6_9STRA|nr:hypothetical protein PF010_g23787 [Phytophthora fragariae]KAE9189353.1 hypothetical protein PF002_g25072 [Phytophthora fragariae]
MRPEKMAREQLHRDGDAKEGAAVPHLALNNISKIEGLRSCEFLNKLDLTVYPVDFNTGGELITPSLCSISRGVLHTRQPSESNSETGLREYAATSTRRQGDPPPQGAAAVSRSTTVPHMKREMYMEMAEQEEEEARRCENQPKERSTKAEHETEHEEVLRKDRLQEMDPFSSATKTNGHIHPSYVFVVAKNKVLRLNFSEFVRLDAGTGKAKITGTLRLTLSKAQVAPTQQLRVQLCSYTVKTKERS